MTSPNQPLGPEAVRFRRSAGESLVYGGLAFAAFSALGALVSGLHGIFYLSGAAVLLALHYLPMLNAREAPLILEDRGLIVSGLGLVPWDAIQSANVIKTHVRSMSNAQLAIDTKAPLGEIVRKQTNANPFRALQTRVWKRQGANRVEIRMNALAVKPDDVLARIEGRISPPSGT